MSKVAIVTGATRGIGKASAISLARAGFDLVLTGRTLKEGEGRATLPYAEDGQQVEVPGSLETTAAAIRALGREALPVVMDVLDRSSMDAVVEQTLERWGRIDLLLNNALYQGPGLMFGFSDFSIEQSSTAEPRVVPYPAMAARARGPRPDRDFALSRTVERPRWSGRWESNPRRLVGNQMLYH